VVRQSTVAAVLFLAVLAVSMSGPLVRLSHAPALAIATWRLAFSLGIIAFPLTLGGGWRQLRALDARSYAVAMLGGAMLALHFWSWNTSVQLTTVAASVLLVNTQPLVVGALSAIWLRERPTAQQWAGIGIALAGAAIVMLPDLRGAGAPGGRAMLGDLLALVGAITAATYYTVGRRLRGALDLWPYVALVYGTCFVVLVVISLATQTPLGPYPPRELGIFALLAIFPMLLGHTLLNWALKHVRAYLVIVVLLGEPILATIIAALVPGIREMPTILTVIGGTLVLGGIVVAERRPST
jgi:drug/metabolite transporter (DMT)-like permease